MSIKNVPDLKTEKDAAITIDGVPDPVDSTDHNDLLENTYDSISPRLQVLQVATPSAVLDFSLAGSRGGQIWPLVGDVTITSIINPVKGDTIFVIVHNDFDFIFNDGAIVNFQEMGEYNQNAFADEFGNVVRVTCVNNELSANQFVAEWLNTKQIDDILADIQAFKDESEASDTFTVTAQSNESLNANLLPIYAVVTSVVTEDTIFSCTFKFELDTTNATYNFIVQSIITGDNTGDPQVGFTQEYVDNLVNSRVVINSPPVFARSGESITFTLFATATMGGDIINAESRLWERVQIIPT